MNKNKNMRFTRRSYKRKLIIFGVSIFMSIALSATGFAAWLISKDTNQDTNGQVQIGAVSEASVEISDITFIGDVNNFIFEPLEEDVTGRVRYDGTSAPENLGVEFTWTIKNYQTVSDVFVEFKLPASVYTAVTKGWLSLSDKFELSAPTEINGTAYTVLKYKIQESANKITDNGSKDGIIEYTVTKDESTGLPSEVVFTMNIDFEWGDEFHGDNPGVYYDESYEDDPTAGINVSYAELKATLNEFKATLHGITYNADFEALSEADKAAQYTQKPIKDYFIVINATVA